MLPRLKVALARRNASKREKLVTGFVIMTAMVFLWIEGTSGALQPNLTSVESWGETQIKVTWQRFKHVDSNAPHFYELYIDDYLEYFGNDVIYVARRLTPDTMYHFKLRSCIRETNVCSLFSKTLTGTTDQSRKRGFTKSFIQWTILWLVFTILAATTALLGAKITRRLWRSFLYRYDYRSETNLQVPKYVASADTTDEDFMSSLCLNPVAKMKQGNSMTNFKPDTRESSKELSENEKNRKENEMMTEGGKLQQLSKNDENAQNVSLSIDANHSTEQNTLQISEKTKGYSEYKNHTRNHFSSDKAKCDPKSKHVSNDNNLSTNERILEKSHVSNIQNEHRELTNTEHAPFKKHSKTVEARECSKLPCNGKTEHEYFTKKRAHSIPKIARDVNSKGKNNGHRRARSLDSNIQNKIQHEVMGKAQNIRNVRHHAIPHSILDHSCDLVIVVDNSNIFIGAQECATLVNSNERKRNIRVKIQQLVKVFQRGRTVTRAFVQGSSPPTSELVWEVYRRLGYTVDLEDRRGKDEQRVDEGLHLHIYKALCEQSPQTLVIASGDGNKGKSEGASSLPGCAQAAIERGWHVEVHSWQHSTSMEWLRLSKKYPEKLTIHFLDRKFPACRRTVRTSDEFLM